LGASTALENAWALSTKPCCSSDRVKSMCYHSLIIVLTFSTFALGDGLFKLLQFL
jgi:hypothetical protein